MIETDIIFGKYIFRWYISNELDTCGYLVFQVDDQDQAELTEDIYMADITENVLNLKKSIDQLLTLHATLQEQYDSYYE